MRTVVLLAISGLLVSLPSAAQPPAHTFREHPADAARRDVDGRFRAGQVETDPLRAETRQDVRRQRDQSTPEGLRPEDLRQPPLLFPPPGPR